MIYNSCSSSDFGRADGIPDIIQTYMTSWDGSKVGADDKCKVDSQIDQVHTILKCVV